MIRKMVSLAVAASALQLTVGIESVAADLAELNGVEYRNIGPTRGGRATAIAGHPANPAVYYMGSTGGVFKTTDAGAHWSSVGDGTFKTGSVGAIAIAPSNQNVIVVGMGESPYRGVASSHGDGVYRSVDAGKSFQHLGLDNGRQISTVHIHPSNPDVIWVAAQGSPWAPTEDRGVYKTTDGGKNWAKTLYIGDTAGAVDLTLDPGNPKILYAALWDHQRQPWEIRSGGPNSGIWRSMDGGDTWEKMAKGLPESVGKIGVAASPAKAGRVFAIVEAPNKKGGLYRSDDYGDNWQHMNSDRKIYARSWYYMHVFADPKDADTVYVENSAFYKSIDGGKNFPIRITGSHGDWHDFWLNPENPQTVAVANDGGAAISFNGGLSWTSEMNQPTAQFYRVNTDNGIEGGLFYKLYAGQQDNSTVAVYSSGPDGGVGPEDFHPVGGCESAHVAFDPDNPTTVYAGCYLGQINRWEAATLDTKNVSLYPEISFGVNPVERKYRFNWNAPIVVSQHDRSTVYHAGNIVAKSTTRGESWDVISPDLTRADPETLGPGGRPITNEVSENYATLMALSESPFVPEELWTGSDDGLVHVTRNGGEDWIDVSPDKRPGLVNSIELSTHDRDKAYVVYTRYKYNDHTPYIFKTTNGGKAWRNIAKKGIREGDFIRVVREDPKVPGLLYAGSETGVYVSYDDGKAWEELQLNLPHVPVTDMKIQPTAQGDDLVLSTQGRAFWILDDLEAVRLAGMPDRAMAAETAIAVRYNGRASMPQMPNREYGLIIDYRLPDDFDIANNNLSLTVKDSEGTAVRSVKADPNKKGEPGGRGAKLSPSAKPGINRFVWDLTADPGKGIKGLWSFAWGNTGTIGGAEVDPGDYTVEISVDDVVTSVPVTVQFDPRFGLQAADFAEKRQIQTDIDAAFMELTEMLRSARDAKAQLTGLKDRLSDEELKASAEALIKDLGAFEDSIISKERTFFQDVLNWPDKLVSNLAMMRGNINEMVPPITQGLKDRIADVMAKYEAQKASGTKLLEEDIPTFNAAFRASEEGVISTSSE